MLKAYHGHSHSFEQIELGPLVFTRILLDLILLNIHLLIMDNNILTIKGT